MLVTVTLVATQNQGVSTPIGRLNPGDLPISQVVRPARLEQIGTDLASLEALGLITWTVADDPSNDDRAQIMTRNAQSNSSTVTPEFQGEDITFYVKIPVVGGAASDIVIIPAGSWNGKQLRILDMLVNTTTLSAASTAQLFDTAGGGGTAMSSTFSMATAVLTRNSPAATAFGVMVKAKGLFLRRSTNSNSAGEAVIWARAEF